MGPVFGFLFLCGGELNKKLKAWLQQKHPELTGQQNSIEGTGKQGQRSRQGEGRKFERQVMRPDPVMTPEGTQVTKAC